MTIDLHQLKFWPAAALAFALLPTLDTQRAFVLAAAGALMAVRKPRSSH